MSARNGPRYGENEYGATCIRVIDGDTVHLDVDLGLRVHRSLYVRLVGIDAPEPRGSTKEAGKAATKYLEELLFAENYPIEHTPKPLVVQFEKGKSFDRWLGRLFIIQDGPSDIDVQKAMVEAGHAEKSIDG